MVTRADTGSSSGAPVARTLVVKVASATLPAVTLTAEPADSDNNGEIGRTVDTLTSLISWISF
jgi:hypothetical protein